MARDTNIPRLARPVRELVGDRVVAALSALGISDPSERVWARNVPEEFKPEPPYPRVLLTVTTGQNLDRSTLQKVGIVAETETRVAARTSKQLDDITDEVQSRLTDLDNKIEPTGYQTTHIDQLNPIPANSFPTGERGTYQEIVRVNYHMKSTD